MTQADLSVVLQSAPQLADKLYCRGYLLTDAVNLPAHLPFPDNWRSFRIGDASLFVHPALPVVRQGNLLLLGHAYNPLTLEYDEALILQQLQNAADFIQAFHALTGVFTLFRFSPSGVQVFGDPTGLQSCFYAALNGRYYVSSHTLLLGTLLDLRVDSYVSRLSSYRFFPLLGNSLPGDLTQFAAVKRLVPNHSVLLDKTGAEPARFYTPRKLQLETDEIARKTAELLHNNLLLIARKWKKPAISMTGGCDSKTTLACANGLYDRFSYFSYCSSDSERVDADAAARICSALGLSHRIYQIPDTDAALPAVPEAARLLRWNCGDLCDCNPNDVRKRVFFADTEDFDVEVKSWASEVGRAYYSKRFNGRMDFGAAPAPRACTSLYKFFLHNRKLVRQTDQVFEAYLEQYFRQDREHPLPWQEQFFWEFRMPSWNGLVITGEHRYSFDITVPYNNRLILELLVSAPLQSAYQDEVHKSIRQLTDPRIDGTGIAVQNVKHTSWRAQLEALYYQLNQRIP